SHQVAAAVGSTFTPGRTLNLSFVLFAGHFLCVITCGSVPANLL
ncbi:hypothetical protein A2U01_0079385, partial [Trifolium medium]|nr:hypothetical protein [Trifolium medium]